MTTWVDASSGASGDMLLGALLGAGVPVAVLQAAVDAVAPEPVALRVEHVARGGFAATRCHVELADSVQHRTWRDVRDLLVAAPLDPTVRDHGPVIFAAGTQTESVKVEADALFAFQPVRFAQVAEVWNEGRA